MKKIIFVIMLMFVSINFVFAKEEYVVVDVVSIAADSVTLKVLVDDLDHGDVCYLYRSNDMVNYDNQMLIDCNMMYVDKGLESGVTYYYKAKVGNGNDYSDDVIVTVNEMSYETLKLTRDVSNFSNIGVGFVVGFVIVMLILVVSMTLFKKRLS